MVWKKFGCFYLFSFLILAVVPVASLVFGISMDFSVIGERAAQQSGIAWTSSLLNLFRLAFVEPGLILLIFGASVPMLAALASLLIFRDFSLTSLLRRLHPFGSTPAKSAMLNYVLMIVVLIICLLATGWIRHTWLPETYSGRMPSIDVTLLAMAIGYAFLDQGALLEEGGWRGYATSLLQGNAISPLFAALLVGICWSFWHIPRDIVSGLPGKLGLISYLLLYLPAFTLGTVSVSIVASYFMNRLGGSIVPAILVHGLINDAVGLSGFAEISTALTPSHQITNAMPLIILAVGIIVLKGSRLGLVEVFDQSGTTEQKAGISY